MAKPGTAQKVARQLLRILPWDQNFDEMVTMWENCTNFEELAAKEGAWESSMVIGLAEQGKNCRAITSLENEEDWKVWKYLFKKSASTQGKEMMFKVVWSFQAKRATERATEEPGSDATSADSDSESPLERRTTSAPSRSPMLRKKGARVPESLKEAAWTSFCQGLSKSWIAKHYGFSRGVVQNLIENMIDHGTFDNVPTGTKRGPKFIIHDALQDVIEDKLKEEKTTYQSELAQMLKTEYGVVASKSTISRALKRAELTNKN